MNAGQFLLRPARREEAWAIRRLIWKVRINPTGLDWQRFVIVLDANGRLLGTGQIKPHGDHMRELASIAVEPEFRGRGIARAIILHLLSSTPRPLFLRCAAPMRDFYLPYGFNVVPPGEMPPEFFREWRIFDWLRRRVFRKMPELYIMRVD